MIESRTMSWIAMACFALGFAGLWLAFDQPQSVSIDSINDSMHGQRVQTHGVITSRFVRGNQLFLELRDQNALRAIAWNASEEEKKLSKRGERVRAIGTIEYSKGRATLLVEKLERLD